jgi:hypothetical protein
LIKEYFVKKGIPHDFFRHTAFTVRADNDSTRWRVGKVHEKMMNKLKKIEGHLKVKARDEYMHQKQMEQEDKKL